MKNIIYILLFCFMINKVEAQQPSTMFFMDNMPQAMQLNPANAPNCKFYIGLPILSSVSFRTQSDISLEDILMTKNDGTYALPTNSPELYNQFVNGLGSESVIRADISTNLLSFGFKTKRGYFGFNSNIRGYGDVGIPTDLFRMNKLTVGTHIDLSATNLSLNLYKEFGFNYSYNVNDRLQVGVKYKFLSGLGSVNTNIKQASIDVYANRWEIKTDAEINISAPVNVITNEKGQPEDVALNEERFDDPVELAKYYGLSFKNPGHAFDVGVKYQVLERLNVQASVLDMGWINWNNDVTTVSASGNATYSGIDFDLNQLDSIDDILSNLADTLASDFSYGVDSTSSFRTNIPTKIYLGTEYDLNDYFSLGLLYNGAFYKNYSRHKMVYSLNYNGMRGWAMGVNYNMNINGNDYLGAMLSVKLSPFQLYICTEGIPLSYQKYKIDGQTIPFAKSFSGIYTQVGVNIRFGCKRNKNAKFREAGSHNRFPYI